MESRDNLLSFSAIRGIQAGREYYVAMCPMKVIAKIFLFDELELAPELRAQRILNKARVPEITSYLVQNIRSYIFSSITASIDGDVRFEPFVEAGSASSAGRLLVPMAARFLIIDGQHRRAAIETALRECPELGDETLSVVFFNDAGVKRSQQMFADLNRHAIRPTKSIGILYDGRDPLSQLAYSLSQKVNVFKNLVEMERTSVPDRSNRLFALSSVYQATQTLLAKTKRSKVTEKETELAVEFWESVGRVIPDWQLASQKKVSCAELRRDFIHAHGITLQAVAVAGASLIAESPRGWKRRLDGLLEIDWSRSNVEIWEGRALLNGRVSKAHSSILLTANLLKQKMGLALGAKEKALESQISSGKRAA